MSLRIQLCRALSTAWPRAAEGWRRRHVRSVRSHQSDMVVQQLASWVPSGFEPWRLRPLLHDDFPDIRATAALVAGQLKAAVLIDELQLRLEDGNETSYKKTVAVEASEALDRISGKRPPWEAHRRQPVSRI
jgi:hypothetical protein